MRLDGWAGRLYAAEAGRAVLWLPVALGAGIWVYFALPQEPHPAWAALVLAPVALLLTGAPRRAGALPLGLALVACAGMLGFSAALLHARAAVAPMLEGMVEETVEGRVLGITRAASGAPRVLLDGVRVYGIERAVTPVRLRIALVETELGQAPPPGARIRVHARLFPPGGPVEPGGFDFRKSAFFERIGAVGYALGPVLRVPDAAAPGPLARMRIGLADLRNRIADGLRAMLPGPEGAFAAAILVGDRAGIEEPEEEALRAANLSHLLAISGLHMGMLCGIVFAAVRLGVAAVPALALSVSGKKIAAAAALGAGAGYLLLSGATVPTQRAFVMVAVALVAVLLDRPALTLRALAVAATIVLLARPVSLLDPGFRMSFAATAALVAAFEGWRARRSGGGGRLLRGARLVVLYLAGVAATSAVAGLATAPYAAHHFNRVAAYGLPANLAALPVMGLWIAPMAVVAGVAAPVGLADGPVALMGEGIAAVLAVAREVSGWPGAVRPVGPAPALALGLLTLGGLWVLLWRSPLRWAGLPALAAAFWLWADAPPRPEVLIAPGARLVGVIGPEGRAVDHPRAQGFAAETWLLRDGDDAAQEAAAARPGLEHGRGWARAALAGGWRLEVLHGREPDPARLSALCRPKVLLVARHGPPLAGPCCYFGGEALETAGALAIRLRPDGLEIESAAASSGARLWSARSVRAGSGPAPVLSRCGSGPPSGPGS